MEVFAHAGNIGVIDVCLVEKLCEKGERKVEQNEKVEQTLNEGLSVTKEKKKQKRVRTYRFPHTMLSRVCQWERHDWQKERDKTR